MKGFILVSLGNEGPEMTGSAIHRTDSTETPTTTLFYL